MPGRYAPLLAYLAALPPDAPSVRLTFAEIEAIIGAPLAASASSPGFWTSSYTAHQYWRRHGWNAKLHHADRAVVFTRRPA